jgi:inorganic pyrophosphatase
MANDSAFGHWQDIGDIPRELLERLQHYFLTYKDAPGAQTQRCRHGAAYGREEAYEVICCSQEDYVEYFQKLTGSVFG